MRITAFVVLSLAAGCVTGDDAVSDETLGGDDSTSEVMMSTSASELGVIASTGPYFATPMFFNRDVRAVPKAATSDAQIAALKAAGGWGNSNKMQIDFTISVNKATSTTTKRAFTKNSYFYSPDCDSTTVPLPSGGNVEGNTGYTCSNGGDCHLIVYDTSSKKLYEMYKGSATSSTFSGGCLAVWDGNKTYTDKLRGEQCTSADAAGLPIAPLLINADEVKAGVINHAIRFVLPNNRVKRGYTRPATHGTATSGSTSSPSYGVHLRLRANYPIDSLPTAGAKVVARAMQKYGMYHADGGNIALTAQSDRNTTAKWAGLLGASDLAALKVEDFEVVQHSSALAFGYNCVRTP
jgi:serine/threonine-protein kinase